MIFWGTQVGNDEVLGYNHQDEQLKQAEVKYIEEDELRHLRGWISKAPYTWTYTLRTKSSDGTGFGENGSEVNEWMNALYSFEELGTSSRVSGCYKIPICWIENFVSNEVLWLIQACFTHKHTDLPNLCKILTYWESWDWESSAL